VIWAVRDTYPSSTAQSSKVAVNRLQKVLKATAQRNNFAMRLYVSSVITSLCDRGH
jgi:hypothetical protein